MKRVVTLVVALAALVVAPTALAAGELAISVVSGWIYAGFYMAIFYAALQRIPQHIVEAARQQIARVR